MARALSVDLRDRVVAAIAGGLWRRKAADRFGVSATSAVRWQQLANQHGTPAPQQQGGDQRSMRIEACRVDTGGLQSDARHYPDRVADASC
jgi:transposase